MVAEKVSFKNSKLPFLAVIDSDPPSILLAKTELETTQIADDKLISSFNF